MASDDSRAHLPAAGRWLREQRQRRGYQKAVEFARALDVDASLVSNYERGVTSVPDDKAQKIADLFSLDIIEVRRNLGLWVPPQTSGDELTEPEDDPELLRLIRQARRERDAGDPTLYKMLMRLQDPTEQETGSRADEAPGGTQQAS